MSYHSIVDHFALCFAVILAVVIGKLVAVEIAGHAFHYSSAARLTVWALTLPQVAAALAAALVAHEILNRAGQRLIDGHLLNVVLVLMLTTAILGGDDRAFRTADATGENAAGRRHIRQHRVHLRART